MRTVLLQRPPTTIASRPRVASTIFRVIFVAAALLAFGVASFAQSTAAPPSPEVGSSLLLENVLPNGIRYAILPHGVGSGPITLRLLVHAGSLAEHDDERGYAHLHRSLPRMEGPPPCGPWTTRRSSLQ